MKKIILISDSFKGTLSSKEVCDIEAQVLESEFPGCQVVKRPIADGGEGTVSCFLGALKGQLVHVPVCDAFGTEMAGFYGRFDDFAVIEMAAVAGIVSNSRRDPMIASTYGVGQLIKHAIDSGCRKILLGLGGSVTNDCGAGMAAALGTKFYNEAGQCFIPAGGNLDKVKRIERGPALGAEISCMCDITNPLYGASGAAYVFGPQKGASPDQVKVLDENLVAFANTIKRELGVDVSQIPGGGAAGGMGAGSVAFLGASLKRGIDYILDIIGFDQLLDGADLVITGEGRLDSQSLGGKVVSGVTSRAGTAGVPVIAVCGASEISNGEAIGICRIYETSKGRRNMAEISANCREDLRRTMIDLSKEIGN